MNPFPFINQTSFGACLSNICSALKFPSMAMILRYFQLSRSVRNVNYGIITTYTHCVRSTSSAGGILTPGWGHAGQKRTSSPGPGSSDIWWNPCHLRSFKSLHALDNLRSSLYLFYLIRGVNAAVNKRVLYLPALHVGMHCVTTMSSSGSYPVTPVTSQLYSSTPVVHHLLWSRSRRYTSVKYNPWSNPYTVLTTPRRLPCLDMSSPCTQYISYLVSFSLDLT